MRQSAEIVDLVRDDQWGLPTPCSRWNLRQLVEHMILENRGFAAAADGERVDRTVWDDLTFDDDLRADYRRSVDRVVAAFGADGVLDRGFWLPKISHATLFPAPQAISFHLLDYVVHGWDVAAALGHPIEMAADLATVVLDIADREVPDIPRRQHPDASFRPPIPLGDDAPEQDRLLAVLGRSPRWPD